MRKKRFKYCQRQYRIYSSNGISQSSPSPFSSPSKSSFLNSLFIYTRTNSRHDSTNSGHAMTPSDNEKRGESTQSFIPSFPHPVQHHRRSNQLLSSLRPIGSSPVTGV